MLVRQCRVAFRVDWDRVVGLASGDVVMMRDAARIKRPCPNLCEHSCREFCQVKVSARSSAVSNGAAYPESGSARFEDDPEQCYPDKLSQNSETMGWIRLRS